MDEGAGETAIKEWESHHARAMDAIETLASSQFPKLDKRYLYALISTMVCKQSLGLPFGMIWAHGPSKAAKTTTARLAAELAGASARVVELTPDSAEFAQQFGYAVMSGSPIIIIDEADKGDGKSRYQDSTSLLAPVLRINTTHEWNIKHGARRVDHVRAVIVFTGITIPDSMRDIEQFGRRCADVELNEAVPSDQDWAITCGGDVQGWRGRDESNDAAASLIISRIFDHCRLRNYNLSQMYKDLEVGMVWDTLTPRIAEQHAAMRCLYRVWLHSCRLKYLGKSDPQWQESDALNRNPLGEKLPEPFADSSWIWAHDTGSFYGKPYRLGVLREGFETRWRVLSTLFQKRPEDFKEWPPLGAWPINVPSTVARWFDTALRRIKDRNWAEVCGIEGLCFVPFYKHGDSLGVHFSVGPRNAQIPSINDLVPSIRKMPDVPISLINRDREQVVERQDEDDEPESVSEVDCPDDIFQPGLEAYDTADYDVEDDDEPVT